jgi:hypothetical protein
MVIEYKVSFENGAVTISQRVEPDAPSPQPISGSNGLVGTRLGNTFPGTNAAASGGGNTDPTDSGGGNTDPTDSGGGNTDPTDSGGGGKQQGQVVVFGPIVIDASGLIARHGVRIEGSAEKNGEKPEK